MRITKLALLFDSSGFKTIVYYNSIQVSDTFSHQPTI